MFHVWRLTLIIHLLDMDFTDGDIALGITLNWKD